jgi:hypothetical protein
MHGQEFFRERAMDGNNDLVARSLPHDPELWPGSGIRVPGWNPDGVLGGVVDLHPPANGLQLFMTAEQRADAGLTPAGALAGQSGSGPDGQGLGGVPDNGLNGVRPAGWDAPNGDSHGQSPVTIDQVDPDQLVPGRPEGMYLGDYLPHGIRTPIGPVPGYPETGRGAWRSELDDQITMGVNDFNSKHGFKTGDSLYLTPGLAKSWIMEESGGTRSAFETDPIQVNNPKDWKNTGKDKEKLLGLTEGQTMAPMTSIPGGLNWFFEKGAIHDANHAITGYRRLPDALKAYNGNTNIDPNGLPHNVNYANSILGGIGKGYGAQER